MRGAGPDMASVKLEPYDGPRARIAVAKFEDKTTKGAAEIGEGMSTMLTTALVNSGRFIVLERDADLSLYTEEAIALDARVTADALFAIFIPSHENPLHDGAVIISKGRISHAGCFLPLTDNPKIDKALARIESGTFGICEKCEEEISLKRLEARPVTTLCIRCKEEQEQKEKSFG